MNNSSHPSPSSSTPSRPRARKTRPQVNVPADTLLTFTRYHHPPPHRPQRSRPLPALPPRPREAFVQANHRFLVDPTYPPGYVGCTALPDEHIPWQAVDAVLIGQKTTCPISLEDLRCARVTPCGHVFEYVCILQHLKYCGDEHQVAKCPLCGLPIRKSDLRMCAFLDTDVVEVGLPLHMRLVSRVKGSMIAVPHGENVKYDVPRGIEGGLFSRFAFSEPVHLKGLLAADLEALRGFLKEDVSLKPFVDIAVEDIKLFKAAMRMRRNESIKVDGGELWYFYQARDTQNVFLAPVNHRCLATEFDGVFGEVSEVEGIVLEIERMTMTEGLRKKYKFLEHLPAGCEVAFVELDLSPMLSAKTLATHEAELKERRVARKKRETKTRKEDKRLEKRQSASLRQYFNSHSNMPPHLANQQSVDSNDVTVFPALPENDNQPQESSPTPQPTPQPTWGTQVSSYSSVTSNMGLFPTLDQTLSSSYPPPSRTLPTPTPQGVWGSSARQAPEESRRRKTHKSTIVMSNARSPYRR